MYRRKCVALLYYIDYLLKLATAISKQLIKDVKEEIRGEEEMLHLFKENLPPTLAGVLELARQEGFKQGFEQGFKQGFKQRYEQGMKQIITGLIEKGAEDEWIAEVAKLPEAKIREIRMELK
ncbi:hypothetical protein LAV72_06530 [Lysinibacillus xylanilyticus]|uniref:hypothetical protein n=1 Tax=Lysinibacillus xylanilyticus TaxID=582475 RepID=UPI002B2503E7|nr:hypothetical protein [Lysinibacillus xylanilyticus]MEB2299278.1 hypothetical protein [Lysinibacillus xylanilyticus]